MSELKHSKQIAPSGPDLSSDINPEPFNPYIVDASAGEISTSLVV